LLNERSFAGQFDGTRQHLQDRPFMTTEEYGDSSAPVPKQFQFVEKLMLSSYLDTWPSSTW
jgi:hypothetical protein